VTRQRFTISLTAYLLIAAMLQGCGKKGPPLAPLVIVPARISSVTAKRFNDHVYITLQIPSEDTIESELVDFERVEIYAMTTQPGDIRDSQLTFDDWVNAASLVTTIRVRPPDSTDLEEEIASVSLGEDVTVVELLTSNEFVPVVLENDAENLERDTDLNRESSFVLPLISPSVQRPLKRTYIIRGISTRGREGSPSLPFAVPLTNPPDPPSQAIVTYTEDEIRLSWELPLTARLPIQELAVDGTLESAPSINLQVPSTFEVYEASEVLDVNQEPLPLNSVTLASTNFTFQQVTFGIEKCYVIRTVDVIGGMEIRSRPSAPTCVQFMDTFPPAVPSGLIAVATEGAVNLVWDANAERDLEGYVVWRGQPSSEILEALTIEPTRDTTFFDVTVEAGTTYEYAVQAVDQAVPPNYSVLSDRVVERAR
jgi:hypothetical protein